MALTSRSTTGTNSDDSPLTPSSGGWTQTGLAAAFFIFNCQEQVSCPMGSAHESPCRPGPPTRRPPHFPYGPAFQEGTEPADRPDILLLLNQRPRYSERCRFGSLVGPTGQLPHLNPRPRPRTISADRRRPEASRGASLAVPFGVPALTAARALSPCFREEGFPVTRYRAGLIRCACRSGGCSCRASDSLQISEQPCAKACRAATPRATGPVGRSIWPPRCRPSGRIDPGARYDPRSNDPPDCGGRRRTRCRTDQTEPEQKIPRPEHGASNLGGGADSLLAATDSLAK